MANNDAAIKYACQYTGESNQKFQIYILNGFSTTIAVMRKIRWRKSFCEWKRQILVLVNELRTHQTHKQENHSHKWILKITHSYYKQIQIISKLDTRLTFFHARWKELIFTVFKNTFIWKTCRKNTSFFPTSTF